MTLERDRVALLPEQATIPPGHSWNRLPLIGGDTISLTAGAPRVFGLTAIGRAGAKAPERSGGKAGDGLWLVGTLGDSAAGLKQLLADRRATGVHQPVRRG